MLSTTGYSRGDVVLVSFLFTDESGARRRPVVVLRVCEIFPVGALFGPGFISDLRPREARKPICSQTLSSEDYHRGRQEAIVAAITSNTDRILVGDHLIADWQTSGLLFPSVATGNIRTVKQSMAERKLGSMSSRDMRAIEASLKLSLDLG